MDQKMDLDRISEIEDMFDEYDYSDYQPSEAEALKLLDKTVEGVIIEATIMTEMEKLWRSSNANEPKAGL